MIGITVSNTNIFVAIVKSGGEVLLQHTAAQCSKGAKRKGKLGAKLVGRKVAFLAFERGLRGVVVKIKGGVSRDVYKVLEGLVLGGISIKEIRVVRSKAHNGVRGKKLRRL